MKNKNLPKSLTILFLFLFHCLSSQSVEWGGHDDIHFERVIVPYEEGLRNAMDIGKIIEDDDGVFWIPTVKGLFRFNGHSALNITEFINRRQQNIFAVEWVNFVKLIEDDIWIGTPKGLYTLHRKTLEAERIVIDQPLHEENFRNNIMNLIEEDGRLLICTMNGLYVLDKYEKHVLDKYFTNGNRHSEKGSDKYIYSYHKDIDSNFIWLGIPNGLAKVNVLSKQYELFSPTDEGVNRHFFRQGDWLGDTLLFHTYNYGICAFDRVSKTFKFYSVSEEPIDFPFSSSSNRFRSKIPLDGPYFLVSAETRGNGIFNSNSKEFMWLPGNRILNEGIHSLNIDHKGYAWCGRKGWIYRSSEPVAFKKETSLKHTIDITHIFSNNRLIYQPCFEGYENVRLEEYDRENIEITFSLTNEFVLDTVSYEYSINGREWKIIEMSNQLQIGSLSPGNQRLKIRARSEVGVIADSNLTIYVSIPFYKRKWFFASSILLTALISWLIYKTKINRIRSAEQLKSAYNSELASLKSKALRAQINPHFIFNTLTSIKHYSISRSREETADYITSFSILIRKILENSTNNLISLKEEIDTLTTYIEIERKRLGKEFSYNCNWSSILQPSEIKIPPMIIQPFVENAIWHGLIHKDKDRKLELAFELQNDTLICIVRDNGIGRSASKNANQMKTYKSSLGIQITKDRLDHIQKGLGMNCRFEIDDLYTPSGKASGTIVRIFFQQPKMN